MQPLFNKPFHELTRKEVDFLRRVPAGIPMGKEGFLYNFSQAEIKAAQRHLETLFPGRIYQTFAEKILLRHALLGGRH